MDLVVPRPASGGRPGCCGRGDRRARSQEDCLRACDVAALARDLRHFGDLGWRLTPWRALDIFPMTAHVEAIAGLVPTQVTGP